MSYFGVSNTLKPRASAGRMCWNSIAGTVLIFFALAGSFVESALGFAVFRLRAGIDGLGRLLRNERCG